MSRPMRRMRSACCARAANGHAAILLNESMNSRRWIWIAMRPSRRGHATEGTISHLDVLRCGPNDRLGFLTPRSAPACLLAPNADIAIFAGRAAPRRARARPAPIGPPPDRITAADCALFPEPRVRTLGGRPNL